MQRQAATERMELVAQQNIFARALRSTTIHIGPSCSAAAAQAKGLKASPPLGGQGQQCHPTHPFRR